MEPPDLFSFTFLSVEGDNLDMLMRILSFKEPLNIDVLKKIINNWQKNQDKNLF